MFSFFAYINQVKMELLPLYLIHKVLNSNYSKGNRCFDYRHTCGKVFSFSFAGKNRIFFFLLDCLEQFV